MRKRCWIRLGAMMVATALSAGARAADCLNLPQARVAFQLYSVSEVATGPTNRPPPGQPWPMPEASAKDMAKLFRAMHAIGWRHMENFGETFGQPTDQYLRLVRAAGIDAISSHEALSPSTWSAALARAKQSGQTWIGSGEFGAPGLDTLDHVLATAKRLNSFGAAAAKEGLRFFVHSHQVEFTQKFDVETGGAREMSAWEIIAAHTDPKLVSFEFDVGWAYVAFGGDAGFPRLLEFLRAHRDRIKLLHLKGIGPDNRASDVGVGIDYASVIDAAGPGIAYYIWEYDHPARPLDAARRAYQALTCK